LFTRSAFRAIEANPGFSFDSLVIARIDMGLVKYPDARAREILRQADERLSQLPGVESVSASRYVPLRQESWMREVQIGGAPAARENAQSFQDGKAAFARSNIITADYFRTLRIPLVAGREFDRRESDSDTGPRTAILSQTLADKFFPGEDAVGRTVQFPADNPKGHGQILQVVGVVPAITWDLFEPEAVDAIYAPLGQHFNTTMRMHVRTAPSADPQSFLPLIRETLRQIDPLIPITELQTMEAFHREGPILRVMNVGAILFGLFGGVALLLSFIGGYGVKAYAVARRTREIGIRIALGATPRDLIRMILFEGARLVAIGLAAGLILALGISRLVQQFLYGVASTDLLTLLTVPFSLATVMMLACWLPARRAAKVDPMVALRYE
jgi:putative ABC transport system permease protein